MSVATDAGDTLYPEVERTDGETGFLQERHDEAAQAAVYVHADLVLVRKLCECDNVVLAPIREVHCRAHKLRDVIVGTQSSQTGRNMTHEDRVGVDGTRDTLQIDLAGFRVNGDGVHLDAHVRCTLVERGVCRDGYDPMRSNSVAVRQSQERNPTFPVPLCPSSPLPSRGTSSRP